jgi:hypothetical protein
MIYDWRAQGKTSVAYIGKSYIANHKSQILWDSPVGQHAGLVEQQELVNIRHHHLTVETARSVVPAMDLGRGFARLSRGTARQQQHTDVQTRGESEKAQPETPASLFPIFYSHHAFHHIPFSNVSFNGCAVFGFGSRATLGSQTRQVAFGSPLQAWPSHRLVLGVA